MEIKKISKQTINVPHGLSFCLVNVFFILQQVANVALAGDLSVNSLLRRIKSKRELLSIMITIYHTTPTSSVDNF